MSRTVTPLSIACALLFTLACSLPTQAALVANWTLDSNANDATGSHNGSVVGGTVTFGQSPARVTTGLSTAFPNNGHIDVPFSAALNPGSFTVTLWANPTAAGGGNYRSPLTSRDDAPPNTHGYILYNNNAGSWDFWTGDGNPGWHQTTDGAVAINQWSHVAISYNAGTNTKSLYVNGALAASTTAAGIYSPNGPQMEQLHIGSGADNGASFYWDGRIDDVAVFNTALSLAEIQTIRSQGVANFVAGITQQVITPTAASSNIPHYLTFTPTHLIDGSGLSAAPNIDNILTVTHAGSGEPVSWVTNAVNPDYFANGGAQPVLTFDLGGVFDLTDLVAWNYSVPGNAAKDFTIEFSADGGPFGSPLMLTIPQTAGSALPIDLGGSYRADMVRITFTDNYAGQGAGGDRIGLNEIRFVGSVAPPIVPEPATLSLLGLAGLGLLTRRRRAA